jgi:DeoR/GlpR family transcriptional regulator of sugar metabolism
MLVAERHEKIIDLVNEKGSIRVSELSKVFNVTEETIRRDLEKLESEGKLQRSHGGAVSIKENEIEAPYFEREVRNVKEKLAVAEEAVKYVSVNDRIILDASTTAWYMAKRLPDLPVTVLTNSMKVAMELANREKVSVIMVGGTMLPRSLSFVGPQTNNALEYYHVNKAFISCQGIHSKRGISDSNEMQALVKQKMIDIADEIYLLADHTKFGKQAFSRFGMINAIHTIITDCNTAQEQIEEFQDLGIRMIRS